MRQLGDSERQVNGALTMDAFTYYVWELYKIEYDGQKLTFYKKGCGQDKWPEIHVYASGIIDEIYSTVTPIDAYDNDPLLITSETNQPNIIPNIPSFNTATDVALTGLHLNDPMNDPWPTDHSTITWVDPDNDGEPGYTLSSAGTTQHTRTHPDRTFDYWPNAATANITRRIACWSGATRIKGHLTIDSVSSDCSVLTGSVVVESSEGHTNACTLVPKEEWDNTDIICDSDNWMNAERCNSDEVTSYDNEAHAPDTSGVTVTYKLVKAGKLSDSQPTCATVRGYNFDQ